MAVGRRAAMLLSDCTYRKEVVSRPMHTFSLTEVIYSYLTICERKKKSAADARIRDDPNPRHRGGIWILPLRAEGADPIMSFSQGFPRALTYDLRFWSTIPQL